MIMKFEKFLKRTGVHGETFTTENGDKWLVCEGVAMKIPTGVKNLLGSKKSDDNVAPIFEALINVDTTDDVLELKDAVLFHPDGKANDIVRVFATEFGEKIGIYNADYGLLERKDKLTYLEIDVDTPTNETDVKTLKMIVVLDEFDELQGFITGTQRI